MPDSGVNSPISVPVFGLEGDFEQHIAVIGPQPPKLTEMEPVSPVAEAVVSRPLNDCGERVFPHFYQRATD